MPQIKSLCVTNVQVNTFYLGIGRGIAIKLAELGAKVVAVARTQEELESLQKEVHVINWCGCTILYANYRVL